MKRIIAFFRDGKFEEYLGCSAIFLVIIPVIINIVNRSVFSFYSTTLEAVALLAYVWIGYGFYGYLYKKNAHVDMKFIVNKMPLSVRLVFDVLRDIFILAFSAFMVYWGIKLISTNLTRYATGTKIPLAVGYASIVVGSLSAAIRSCWSLVMLFLGRRRKGEATE